MSAVTAQTQRAGSLLDRRRIYIVPTRHGIVLGVLLFAILLGSINYDNALGYMLTFLLGGLYLIGMLHTYRNLAGLLAAGFKCENIFVDEFIRFEVNVTNTSNHTKLNLCLSALGGPSGWLKRRPVVAQSHIAKIDSQTTCHAILSSKGTVRGWQTLPKVKISSIFPLGIFVAWGYFPHTERCLVYPKPEGPLGMPAKSYSSSATSSSGGIGDSDFRGLRQYSAGDPVKRIAWKTLAKSNELMIKQFSGDGDSQLIFEWRQTIELGDTEARLSQLCLWVVLADRAQLSYGLVLPSVSIPEATGEAQLFRCLRALAEY
ncbi:MAG: hypothetical protein ACU84Q_00735 [Gammaproteobacteria bacterium]